MAVARLSRVVDARRVRVRFSFLASGKPEAALRLFGSTCGRGFSAAPGGEQSYYYSVWRVWSARGETRVMLGKLPQWLFLIGSAATCAEGSCGAAEGRIRTAYDVSRSLLAC